MLLGQGDWVSLGLGVIPAPSLIPMPFNRTTGPPQLAVLAWFSSILYETICLIQLWGEDSIQG